jgi:hypothetical protein
MNQSIKENKKHIKYRERLTRLTRLGAEANLPCDEQKKQKAAWCAVLYSDVLRTVQFFYFLLKSL